jgi:hypothetical protein
MVADLRTMLFPLEAFGSSLIRARSFEGEPWPEIISGWIVCYIYISYEQLEQFPGQSWPKRTNPKRIERGWAPCDVNFCLEGH